MSHPIHRRLAANRCRLVRCIVEPVVETPRCCQGWYLWTNDDHHLLICDAGSLRMNTKHHGSSLLSKSVFEESKSNDSTQSFRTIRTCSYLFNLESQHSSESNSARRTCDYRSLRLLSFIFTHRSTTATQENFVHAVDTTAHQESERPLLSGPATVWNMNVNRT